MGRTTRNGRGFTLIELLVVMAIIAIVVSIIIPAMGHARRTARAAATRSLLNNFVQASGQFERDHNRAPGYFTPREMGASANAARGFTTAQNVMLDLAGGIAPSGWSGTTLSVGPSATLAVDVAPELIGSAEGGTNLYFSGLDEKNFVAGVGIAGDMNHDALPSLVDPFGTPIMVWVVDEAASGPVEDVDDFVLEDSDSGVARFYLASNAGVLNSTALGKMARDQSALSLLADGNTAQESLVGILGDPSHPTDLNTAPVLPTLPRGRVIAVSAGPDGVFLGREDKGAAWIQGATKYVYNFYSKDSVSPGDRHADDDGRPTTVDVFEGFDDIFLTGGT